MEKSYNLTKILLPFVKKRLWVALSPDKKRVVGFGETPKRAIAQAQEKKIRKPTILKAIPDYSGFVPLLWR